MKTKLLLILLFITSFAFAQFPYNGILGYYKFDSGNILLDQAGVSLLTQTGTSLVEVADRFNTSASGAIQLNGDHLSRSNVNVSTIVTHAFWIKTNTINSNSEYIIGDSDRPGLSFNSSTYGYDILLKDGEIQLSSRYQNAVGSILYDRGYSHVSNKIIADDIWHHVVIEYSASTATDIDSKIYIDGVLDSTNQYTFPGLLSQSPFTNGNLVIGNNRNQNLSATNQYKDAFDGYFIYDRALTAAEINMLATQDGFCLVPPNTILSVTGETQNSVTVNISNANTYDIAYVKSVEPFSSATILNNVSSSVNITGLASSTPYNVYVREQCSSGLASRWSDPIAFRTLGTIYVNDDATGLNDGSSWTNAYTDILDATAAIIDGREIWIAGGTYKPAPATQNGFVISKENVKLYGGFAGTEVTLAERVLGVNETIISGDINGDDDNILTVNSTKGDNTLRIIVLGTNSDHFLIDGITITAGMARANGTTACCTGGGIYNDGGDNITIRNCRFYRNGTSGEGAAIYSLGGPNGVHIESSVFEENFGLSGGAIGVVGFSSAKPARTTISKCVFINNTTTSTAAAIYAKYFLTVTSSIAIDACEFKGNNSRSGGAIYAFTDNTATLNLSITNSLFDGNISEDNTTSQANSGSSAWLRALGATSTLTSTITNNTFVNNMDLGSANNLNNFNRATLALTTNNAAGTHHATVSNTIFYNNTTVGGVTARSITGLFENLANVTIENSIDQNNFSSILAGNKTNTSSANPLFVDAVNGDFNLTTGSPAIDSGNTSAVVGNSDLLGNQRIFNTTVDMRAYEFGSTLSIDDFGLIENDIKLYPNPTTSVLNIKMKTAFKQATIYSVLGAKVLETSFPIINTAHLKSGMYLIEIQDENGHVSTKRFIKN